MNTPDIQFKMEWVYYQIKNERSISKCNPESFITMSHFSKTQYQKSDRLWWEFHDSYGYQSPCVWHLLFELPVTRGPFQYKDPIASYKDSYYKDKMLGSPAYIYIIGNSYTFTLLGILMLVLWHLYIKTPIRVLFHKRSLSDIRSWLNDYIPYLFVGCNR